MNITPYVLAAAMLCSAGTVKAQNCKLEDLRVETMWETLHIPSAGNTAIDNMAYEFWTEYKTSCFSVSGGMIVDGERNHATEFDANIATPILGNDRIGAQSSFWYFSYPNREPESAVPDGMQWDISAYYAPMNLDKLQVELLVYAAQIFGDESGKGRLYNGRLKAEWRPNNWLDIEGVIGVKFRDRYYSDESAWTTISSSLQFSIDLSNQVSLGLRAVHQKPLSDTFESVEENISYRASLKFLLEQ